MILDASAVIAILCAEPGHELLIAKLQYAPVVSIGAPTLAEALLVAFVRLGEKGRVLVGSFLEACGANVLPFTQAHAAVALEAWTRFGKGRHPAQLNFGDCLAYATAAVAQRPLLCVGRDFPRTDLVLA